MNAPMNVPILRALAYWPRTIGFVCFILILSAALFLAVGGAR